MLQRSARFTVILATLALLPGARLAVLPVADPIPITTLAGRLQGGLPHLDLVATRARWHLDGDTLAGIPVAAFAEPGQSPRETRVWFDTRRPAGEPSCLSRMPTSRGSSAPGWSAG